MFSQNSVFFYFAEKVYSFFTTSGLSKWPILFRSSLSYLKQIECRAFQSLYFDTSKSWFSFKYTIRLFSVIVLFLPMMSRQAFLITPFEKVSMEGGHPVFKLSLSYVLSTWNVFEFLSFSLQYLEGSFSLSLASHMPDQQTYEGYTVAFLFLPLSYILYIHFVYIPLRLATYFRNGLTKLLFSNFCFSLFLIKTSNVSIEKKNACLQEYNPN